MGNLARCRPALDPFSRCLMLNLNPKIDAGAYQNLYMDKNHSIDLG